MAYFLSIYPIAGELIGDAKAIVRHKDREESGIARLLSDYTMVGGLGVVSDAFTAARFGRLGDWLFGPTAGDMLGFAENMSRGDVGGILNQVVRQPAYTAYTNLIAVPILTVGAIEEYMGGLGQQPSGEALIDIGDLIYEDTQRKRE
jgi:hypothetical protein